MPQHEAEKSGAEHCEARQATVLFAVTGDQGESAHRCGGYEESGL